MNTPYSKTKEYKAAYARKWRKENRQRATEARRRYDAKHPDVKHARDKRYRDLHKEKVKAITLAWVKAHPERMKELGNARRKRHVEELRGHYVRQIISRHSETITPKDIPEPLVAAYRDYMKLKRICRKLQTSTR
jgi:hypothetical protein